MNEVMILDGAMGTMIQKAGLKLGERPEVFALRYPKSVEQIHRDYIAAGSNVIYANTFGANRHKVQGTGCSTRDLILRNVAIARKAAEGNDVLVALDVGPIGELMAPLGTLSFDEAYDVYREMVVAGVEAGVDLVVFETFTDLYEVKAAVLAAKENSALPVWVTMSFESTGRTFTGTTVECMASTLDGLGVDAMGINCSLGPREVLPLIERMQQWTHRPLIAKPNAGLPDPASGTYLMTPEDFASQMEPFLEKGVSILGGCCGTTPLFIKALKDRSGKKGEGGKKALRRGVCSSSQMCVFGGIRVIGERINPTGKKRFQEALRSHDMNYIMERALEQAEAGADILDINVGVPGLDEPSLMKDVVQAVQSVVSLPLQIDSSNLEAIEAGLRYANGRVILNSVNAEEEKLDAILPLVKKYGAAVVGLTIGKTLPNSAEERFALAQRILEKALSYGIPKEDLLIDCLTMTVSAQQNQAQETLKAVDRVHRELGLHEVLGVSNISFGLPERSRITTSFLTQAMAFGLDFPIVNPNDSAVMDAIVSYRALSGEDQGCEAYIQRFASVKTEVKPVAKGEMTIGDAVLKGLAQEVEVLTKALLETRTELQVIDDYLIPSLDVVGTKYEKGEIFLPQLINAANAACRGFDYLKARINARGGKDISKGKIILATVEGDIHDIGKNIVRVVLENYGYQVLDLGKDVPPAKIVSVALEEQVRLVGLSALMTTTVVSMKKTIEALRASGWEGKVMVGGAVLTPEYAAEIGADYYTRDAKESAECARKVLG